MNQNTGARIAARRPYRRRLFLPAAQYAVPATRRISTTSSLTDRVLVRPPSLLPRVSGKRSLDTCLPISIATGALTHCRTHWFDSGSRMTQSFRSAGPAIPGWNRALSRQTAIRTSVLAGNGSSAKTMLVPGLPFLPVFQYRPAMKHSVATPTIRKSASFGRTAGGLNGSAWQRCPDREATIHSPMVLASRFRWERTAHFLLNTS